jgi:hypothetical protein
MHRIRDHNMEYPLHFRVCSTGFVTLKGLQMRKMIFLGSLVIVALAAAGCHHGHSSFSYGYSSAPDCGPRYREAYVVEHHDYHHGSYHGHGRHGRYCD